jgi:hypothetical protein
MPVERMFVSLSQFSELLGIDAARFRGVEYDSRSTAVTLVLEPEDDMRQVQTTGVNAPLSDDTSRRKPGKGGKR